MRGDLPHWLFPATFVVVCLCIWFGIAWRNTRKQQVRLLARRPNPTKAEFTEQMLRNVSSATTEFLWNTTASYLEPKFTPHPDDDLDMNLWIDDGDWSMDWPRDFAERQGFCEKAYPDWPKDWPVTLRNFGRWLDMGLASKAQP